MEQLTIWKSFDGKVFYSSEECAEYEHNHPFLDSNRIIFYSNSGKKIESPTEQMLIDNNAFEVFDSAALHLYIKYREALQLKAPKPRTIEEPTHYKFIANKWVCIEDEILKLTNLLHETFTDEYAEKEKECHNLVSA